MKFDRLWRTALWFIIVNAGLDIIDLTWHWFH